MSGSTSRRQNTKENDGKGQIAIPKEIMQPRNRDFHTLKGMIRRRRKTPVSVEETNEAIARGCSGT
jgi:hypothetical protein